MAIPVAILGAGIGAIGGLFGGGGDAKKLAERKARVASAYLVAKGGNPDAWLVLGATGNLFSLPHDVTISAILGSPFAKGYNTSSWGVSSGPNVGYGAVQTDAANKYRELAPMFQTQAQQEDAAGGVGPLGTGTLSTTAKPGSFPMWAVWGLLAVLLLFLLGR